MKVAIHFKSDNFSPDPRATEVKEVDRLEDALTLVADTFGYSDVRVSSASDNINIVGLDVDFDVEVIDE